MACFSKVSERTYPERALFYVFSVANSQTMWWSRQPESIFSIFWELLFCRICWYSDILLTSVTARTGGLEFLLQYVLSHRFWKKMRNSHISLAEKRNRARYSTKKIALLNEVTDMHNNECPEYLSTNHHKLGGRTSKLCIQIGSFMFQTLVRPHSKYALVSHGLRSHVRSRWEDWKTCGRGEPEVRGPTCEEIAGDLKICLSRNKTANKRSEVKRATKRERWSSCKKVNGKTKKDLNCEV
jgi:hypothetical protein